MPLYNISQIVKKADSWQKVDDTYVVRLSNDDSSELTLSTEDIAAYSDWLVAALESLLPIFNAQQTAKYLKCVEAARCIPCNQLFDEDNTALVHEWAKWTYLKATPHAWNNEITLMFELEDEILTLPLTMPEIVWRWCYPDVMNRYDVALTMGMTAPEVAAYCQPTNNPSLHLEPPNNLCF